MSSPSSEWSCSACTFLNAPAVTTCNICGQRRSDGTLDRSIRSDDVSIADQLFNEACRYYSGQEIHGISRPQDYKRAFELFNEAATFGHIESHAFVAQCYYHGHGCDRDYVKSMKHYQIAADGGNVNAMHQIGAFYTRGHGVGVDHIEAMKWYRKAADRGNAASQCNLGDCYLHGEGVARDDVASTEWFRKAAINGDAVAQRHYGEALEIGRGVTRDYEEAFEWYLKSVRQHGNQLAAFGIIRLILSHKVIRPFESGEGMVFKLLQAVADEKSSTGSLAWAQAWLGYCYANGRGITRNVDLALYWYDVATQRGWCADG